LDDRSEFRLIVLVTSDIHGHLYPTDYRGDEEKCLGLAKLSPLIRYERENNPCVLLLDNGDLTQGTPLMYHYAKFAGTETHPAIRALNYLRYDAAVLGNHEYNYGPRVLREAMRESEFPWLSANIVDRATGAPAYGKPYLIRKTNEGATVAILGLTTPYIPNWEQPANIEGLEFRDALETAREWVPRIRSDEKPDVLIVSYHGGFERDPRTGAITEPLTGENQGYEICLEVQGIDVLVTGHQHRQLTGEINGVTIVQPGVNGQALGKVTVELERGAGDDGWKIRSSESELLYPDPGGETDGALLALVAEDERKTQNWLDTSIGIVQGDMTIRDPMEVRSKDHPFIEFVNKVQMETTGAEISSTALFTNESPGFRERITMRDIVSNYIYPNTLKVLRLTGRDIREALEQSAGYFSVREDGTLSVSEAFSGPKPQHYNYDMWEGIEYELNLFLPVGSRVTFIHRQGAPLDEQGEYEVVMNSYRAGGGGNYDMFKGKKIVREITVDMTEILADYIMEREMIVATCNHNWRTVLGHGR
jgi:2',3'-cyclic-nucleotide 2'-phosphodiesterase/3'-nucleotidase